MKRKKNCLQVNRGAVASLCVYTPICSTKVKQNLLHKYLKVKTSPASHILAATAATVWWNRWGRFDLHLQQNAAAAAASHTSGGFFEELPSEQTSFSEPECTKSTGWKTRPCLFKELSISGPPRVIIMQLGLPPSLGHTLSSRFDMSHSFRIR